jgi:hypothetical protein
MLTILVQHCRKISCRSRRNANGSQKLGQAMDVMKSPSSALAKLTKAAEGETRERETREPVHPPGPQATDATELCGDVIRAGAASVTEIEKLMRELQAARDYLQIEGERLQREAARYAHLTQSALASVKMVSESMDKWRETVPTALAKVA